jgi:hypothetical protein
LSLHDIPLPKRDNTGSNTAARPALRDGDVIITSMSYVNLEPFSGLARTIFPTLFPTFRLNIRVNHCK